MAVMHYIKIKRHLTMIMLDNSLCLGLIFYLIYIYIIISNHRVEPTGSTNRVSLVKTLSCINVDSLLLPEKQGFYLNTWIN